MEDTIKEMIAIFADHCTEPELVTILERLLERIEALESRVQTPIKMGTR